MHLCVQNAAFAWPGRPALFENLSFSIQTPSVTSVLGPNGAGKTTLLKCVLGFEKWTAGSETLDGIETSRLAPRDFWRRVACVPQAKSAPFSYTVEETVLMGRSAHMGLFARPSKQDRRIALEALETAGIAALKDRLCSELSGGQYQMVLIARALAAQPELLVMDEPESNLDFKNQRKVLSCIRLLAERGVGTLINTHYPAHALEVSDTALVMRPGKPPLWGAAREVLTEETLSEAFGVPVRIFENHTGGTTVRTVAALGA